MCEEKKFCLLFCSAPYNNEKVLTKSKRSVVLLKGRMIIISSSAETPIEF